MSSLDAARIGQVYIALVGSAAASKRAIAENKRRLRAQLQAIENLKVEAAKHGLELTTDTDPRRSKSNE